MSGYMDGPYTHASSPSGTFKTKDGWIQIIVVKNHEFIKFCDAIGWKDFVNDERFSSNSKRRGHEKLLTEEVQKLFINNTTDYWKKLLTEAEVQNEKVQNYNEFISSEQTKALEVISWLKQPTSDAVWPVPNLPGMPKLFDGSYLSIAPALGQHTKEIMLDNGYDNKIISQLIEEGVII
jgi:crotonobetainyl-CoA:carnitine CoA-transferase CaiB-like acyl-CoA transferase